MRWAKFRAPTARRLHALAGGHVIRPRRPRPPQRSRLPGWQLSHLAERGELREAHRLCTAVLEYRQVGGRDPYAFRELAHGHLPLGEHHFDRHQITSSNSACIFAASTSRATAWASSIRSTSTMSATPRMATPTPPMMTVTPGSARWPGALRTVTANHMRAAATIAPIMTSTYRKAAWENTVPRRTIVTSRHTQTRATWPDTMPRIVITRSGVSGSDPSSGSVANAHTIPACTNTVPASTTTSTARSACTVSLPINPSFHRVATGELSN